MRPKVQRPKWNINQSHLLLRFLVKKNMYVTNRFDPNFEVKSLIFSKKKKKGKEFNMALVFTCFA